MKITAHRVVVPEKFFMAISCMLLVIVVVSSVTRPSFPWDAWQYHLPFGARLWNIGNARETFILSRSIGEYYLGFPLLAEFVQGALWWISGTIAAIPLINSLSLVVFICAAVVATKASLPVLTFGVLSVPLIVLHSSSAYIDLFAGILICFQLLAGSLLVDRWNSEPAYRRFSIHALYIVAAAAAGNTKFMSAALSLAISGYLLTFVILFRPAPVLRGNVNLVITIGVAIALSLITCARNFSEYGNPFFPISINILWPMPGTYPEFREYPTYTEWLGWLARPANWILSITEIDWKIRGVKAVYNIDSFAGAHPERYGPARTGGVWGAFMMISMGLGVALFARTARLNPDALKRHGFLFSSFLVISALTTFLPQSHELRYYLYWPIFLILIICVLMQCAKLTTRTRVAICGLYFTCFLGSEYILRAPLRVFPIYSPEKEIAQKGNSPVIDFARQNGGVCLGEPYRPEQLKYSAVFHGGHYVIEQANPPPAVGRGYPVCSIYELYVPQDGNR